MTRRHRIGVYMVGVLVWAIVVVGVVTNVNAGQPRAAPDGTPIACMFALYPFGTLSGSGSYKNCGGYVFSMNGPETNSQAGWLALTDTQTGRTLEYRFADMPVQQEGREMPMVLVDERGIVLRITVIRRATKIDFMVGERTFAEKRFPLLRPK